MDQDVINAFEAAGIDASFKETFPQIAVARNEDGTPQPIGDELLVVAGEKKVLVNLKPISELFTGNAKPPSFAKGPTPEYMLFFLLIERTAAHYCEIMKENVRDAEFERLYRFLKRRPDGRDSHPLFSYIQAAVRLYMSLRDVSLEEFDEVLGRLALSAKHFSDGYSSAHYLRLLSEHMS